MHAMRGWIDITRRLDEDLLCWPGRKPPVVSWQKRMASGHYCNVSTWELGAHTGTHIDAPLHFIEGGLSVDQIPPDILVGPCEVICGETALSENEVSGLLGIPRLLVRSRHSASPPRSPYPPHGPLMTAGAARALLEHGLVLLGTDRLSVDASDGNDFTLHGLLLGAGCVIVEGLDLSRAPEGTHALYVLPLRMVGAEASPVRALLNTITK